MDLREVDLKIMEIKTNIYSLSTNAKEIQFLYKYLLQTYKDISIFILISNFQQVNREIITDWDFNHIYNYAKDVLSLVSNDDLYIHYLSFILFTRKNNAFIEENKEFLKEKLLQISNFDYEPNTNKGYLASEFNIMLLRIYNLYVDFDHDYEIINKLLQKQKEFNLWTLDYFDRKIKENL